MKRLVLVLVLVFVAATVFAGDGKHCNTDRTKAAKTVELTGKVVCADGDCSKAVFRVANSDKTYDVCSHSKASLKNLGNATVKVKGKLMTCSESESEITELLIDEAKSI